LGYFNGELRFWLGWAQEVAGDHAAAQESWRQARSELESFLKEQPENLFLIADLALTNMGLGDKAAALRLSEQAMALVPIEKDAIDGSAPIEILARVAPQMGEPDRAIAALQKLLPIPSSSALFTRNLTLTPALLQLDPMFDPLRMIRASKNSHQARRNRKGQLSFDRTRMTPKEQNKGLDAWQTSARYWDKYRALIAQMFAPLTSGLVEEARIGIGQKVLDIGGGSGEPSLTISGIVGATGSVVYTDPVAVLAVAD
jgi:tetratricopeptide (TPR) repeat protein